MIPLMRFKWSDLDRGLEYDDQYRIMMASIMNFWGQVTVRYKWWNHLRLECLLKKIEKDITKEILDERW